jgi:hypothetical protein
LFCQNYMDAKLVCQTVGVALTSAIFGKSLIELIEYLPKTSMIPYIWGTPYISGRREYIFCQRNTRYTKI